MENKIKCIWSWQLSNNIMKNKLLLLKDSEILRCFRFIHISWSGKSKGLSNIICLLLDKNISIKSFDDLCSNSFL